MLFVFNIAVEELLNLWVELSQSTLLLSVWEVDAHVSTRRDNVELGIKHINAMNNSVQSRKSKGRVALILPNCVLAANIK